MTRDELRKRINDVVTLSVTTGADDLTQQVIDALINDLMSTDGDAPSIWDSSVPPGGFVCGICGMPVESEPCPDHQPNAVTALPEPSR